MSFHLCSLFFFANNKGFGLIRISKHNISSEVVNFDSNSRISFSLSKVFAKLEGVLSSACCIKQKKSLNALNSITGTTEPYRTPEIILLKSLLILLIRTHYFLLSKYEFTYFSKFLSQPELSSFPIKRSCGMQSKAFGRSMRTPPTMQSSSKFFRHFSINLTWTCWVLYHCL